MEHTSSLERVPDDALLRRLAELLHQSRRVEADLVAHIGEVDARRLYAREASPSMFAYCTEVLHLSEFEAYLRITAARAARQHPVLLAMLREGSLHLTAVAKLAPHLTRENCETLLGRAAHRTKREVEELIAEVAPRPDAPTVVRKLPERGAAIAPVQAHRDDSDRAGWPSTQLGLDRAGWELKRTPEASTAGSKSEVAEVGGMATPESVPRSSAALNGAAPETTGDPLRRDGASRPTPELASPDRPLVPGRPGPQRVEPLSPGRYRVQFTASADLRDKLERLTALMRPSVPDGDLGAIIEHAVTEKLERLEARRFAKTNAPRKSLADSDTSPSSRHIPAAVRRIVHERDGGRCRYVDGQGRRCTARGFLEFHHRHPFGHGGDHSPEAVSLLCRAHNRYLADIDYGRQPMARQRGAGDRASVPPDSRAIASMVGPRAPGVAAVE
jgi:hypothetical protein